MKLLAQFAAACRTMNYAKATEECYTAWVVDSLHFHRRLAASSQSQALCALVFLYREVLGQPLRGADPTATSDRVPREWCIARGCY